MWGVDFSVHICCEGWLAVTEEENKRRGSSRSFYISNFIMKRTIIALAVMATTSISFAQSITGIYRETKIVEKTGNTIKSPFEQYNICKSDANYQMTVLENENADFFFGNIVASPYVLTGEDKSLSYNEGIKITECTKGKFTLKWYSTYPNHAYFPNNDWCTEYYEANKLTPKAKKIWNLLTACQQRSDQNKFIGTWRMMGFSSSATNYSEILPVNVDQYKVYGKKEMLLLYSEPGRKIAQKIEGAFSLAPAYGNLWPIEYPNNPYYIIENGHPVIVRWIDDSHHSVTYVNDKGEQNTEIWERASLPEVLIPTL